MLGSCPSGLTHAALNPEGASCTVYDQSPQSHSLFAPFGQLFQLVALSIALLVLVVCMQRPLIVLTLV